MGWRAPHHQLKDANLRRIFQSLEKYLAGLEADVDAAAGTELWEEVAGDLHPVSTPTSFNVVALSAAEIDADTITLDSGSGESTLTLNDSGQATLFGNEWILLQGANETIIAASTSTTDMVNGSVIFEIVEADDVLRVYTKYSDGTLKFGEVALFDA